MAVQMKDVDSEAGIRWQDVLRTELPGVVGPAALKPGDVLFTSRGSRFYAVDVDEIPGIAVAAPHFFHISIRPQSGILPRFLAWQMNQPPLVRYIEQSAEGSVHRSIRRSVLESMPVVVPSMDEQRAIVSLAQAAYRERLLLQQLIENRQNQLAGIAEQLHNSQSGAKAHR